MITPYAGLHLLPRTLPRCAACADVIDVPDIAEIVSEYSGEKLVHDIHVPEMLLDLPIYNTPHKWADYSHPPGPIRGLSAASQRARALSGYNHTLQGIIDIGTWMDGLSLHRPEQLLLFQPLLVNEGKTLRVGSEFESKYSRAHQFHSLRKWKRLMYLSASDALDEMSNHPDAAWCGRRRGHPDGGTLGPQNDHLDVMLVHKLSPDVQVHTTTVQTHLNQPRDRVSLVRSHQKLHHKIIGDYTVYVGPISSSDSPFRTVSCADFVRLLVTETEPAREEYYYR
jgi:hypothetical protein